MRVPAAILLTMLATTPAMAIDIVSGSGAVVKNGAGLTVVNGDPCSGRMEAVCLDHEEGRTDRNRLDSLETAGQQGGEEECTECGDSNTDQLDIR